MEMGIKEVAAHLDVRPDTLRKWERRHGLVRPRRGANGYRVYTDDDRSRLKGLVGLIRQGLTPKSAARRLRASPSPPEKGNERLRREAFAFASSFSTSGLESVYRRSHASQGTGGAFARIWEPVLARLREKAREGKALWRAAERFTEAYLRHRLSPPPAHARGRKPAVRLAFAALEGEVEELWMLAAAGAVNEQGIGTLSLGPGFPLDGLTGLLRRTGVRHLCLTFVNPLPRKVLRSLLGRLRRALPGLRLSLAGPATLPHANLIPAFGAVFLGTDWDTALEKLLRALKPAARRP